MAATINLFKEKVPAMLLESKIDAGLSLSGSLRGSRHKKVFKKCIQLARKTIGLDVNSHGEVAIGVAYKHLRMPRKLKTLSQIRQCNASTCISKR